MRDAAIIEVVHRHRVLSTEQIAALFFRTTDGRVSSQCRTRLRHLARAGLLHCAEQLQTKTDGRRPYLYMLSPKGRDLMIEELGYEPQEIDWQPSYNDVAWPYLRHQLAINDVYVAIALDVGRIGWTLDKWVDDRILRQMHTERVLEPASGLEVAVVPDAYFVLSGRQGSPVLQFFLELDRATMTVAASSRRTKSWQDKIRAYQVYFDSALVTQRYGTDRIRVLTVTPGVDRQQHLRKATEDVGGRRRYWFTSLAALKAPETLTRPIWSVASHEPPCELVSRL